MKEIPSFTFADCTSLPTIEFPPNLTSIGEKAFSACGSLKSIDLPAELRELHSGAFAACGGLTDINITSQGLLIGDEAFEGLSSLEKVLLPGVKEIGTSAFASCTSLKMVNFDNTIESIATRAFAGCSALTEVYSPSPWPAVITVNTFDTATERQATLYVIPGAEQTYSLAAYWSRFSKIRETDKFLISVPTLTSEAEVSVIGNLVKINLEGNYIAALYLPDGSLIEEHTLAGPSEFKLPSRGLTILRIADRSWKLYAK